jgi:pyrimidine operon attenuation protein / uracil phosphoribosyltransferase
VAVDPPLLLRRVLSHDDIARIVARLAHDIDDRSAADERGPLAIPRASLALVGIRTGGAHLARRLAAELGKLRVKPPDVGILDITLYRDDVLLTGRPAPLLRGTEVPFDVDGRAIVLVDDVLFTGRTVRAGLDALLDLGRPAVVRLAVLVDRGLRELPIGADFVGRSLDTTREDHVEVRLVEERAPVDEVVVAVRGDRRSAP